MQGTVTGRERRFPYVAMIVSAPGFCKPAAEVAYGSHQVLPSGAVDDQDADRWTSVT